MAMPSSILDWEIPDRGAWWATVHGVIRVGFDLATKPPPPYIKQIKQRFTHINKRIKYYNKLIKIVF